MGVNEILMYMLTFKQHQNGVWDDGSGISPSCWNLHNDGVHFDWQDFVLERIGERTSEDWLFLKKSVASFIVFRNTVVTGKFESKIKYLWNAIFKNKKNKKLILTNPVEKKKGNIPVGSYLKIFPFKGTILKIEEPPIV